jgi:uncharacterized protein
MNETALQTQEKSGSETVASNRPAAGVRRVWNRSEGRCLNIWVGIGLILPALILWATHGLLEGRSVLSIENELRAKGTAALFIALATWLVARMQKRPLDDYGIPPRQALGFRFWEGCVWGFGMLSVLLLALGISGHFQIDAVNVRGDAFVRYALGWAAAFLCVAISEEFMFRGYLLFVTSQRAGFWRASVGLSIGFAVAHLGNSGENVLGILQVFGTGLLFCFMIRRTGNLWFAVGYHAAWDWAETFFYGTADSGLLGIGRYLTTSVEGPNWITGGSAGPEGSVVALMVLALCALLIHLRFPRGSYPDYPK